MTFQVDRLLTQSNLMGRREPLPLKNNMDIVVEPWCCGAGDNKTRKLCSTVSHSVYVYMYVSLKVKHEL